MIPRLASLAALGLSGLLVGASATNLFILDADPWLPIGLLLLTALIAWGRRPRTRAEQPSGQDTGQRAPTGAEPGLGRQAQHAGLS